MNDCHRAAAAHPIVRETILQYIHLINYLTGQSPDNFMKEETKQLLRGDYDSFESTWYCKQIIEELVTEIRLTFWSELEAAWPELSIKNVCQLGGYPIMMGRDQDDPASELYYSFRMAVPTVFQWQSEWDL